MSSEDEITTLPIRKRVIARKDDTKESTPIKSDATYTTASRSSKRLRKKANRTFQLPTRDDVWKDIPHSTTPNKTMSRCKCRLLVNNLFKERHRYNYDPDISSGDESIKDFIDDDEDVLLDISDTDSEKEKQTRKRRIKNYHPRIKAESCSEEGDDEERKSGSSSPEDRSCQYLYTNSRSFNRKRKYASQGKTPKPEKESKKEEEIVPLSGSDIDFSSCPVPVKTSVRKANKIESSDTESYSDSIEYVPKLKSKGNFSDIGQEKKNSENAVVNDTKCESVIIHAVSAESEQNIAEIKSKVQNLDQLQNDSIKNIFNVATVKKTDLNPVRSVDEHADLASTANHVSYGYSGESIVESMNESRDDDGEIKSTHKQHSLVIDSDSDAEEFSNPSTSSSIRKSSRAEDQIKIKSEARKNLFKEFKAARKRSLSGDNT
ncbi:hypothetical protein CHS0354_014915 [Potamilus streckersoni]|uniref:Uncharacterized protein n=1 Tax=Potamilus streckersoni TaxID=2493646 RepID=A0AAE0SS41_9BIVA|nr:hypothetical protein CHS0354_014915 [Potamilus streckersoni]